MQSYLKPFESLCRRIRVSDGIVFSLQKIEAPVRDNDSADKSYAYGGKSIGDRQSDVDRLLVDRNEPEEKSFLGTEVAFPDALRFKGAAPEVANSRYFSFCMQSRSCSLCTNMQLQSHKHCVYMHMLHALQAQCHVASSCPFGQ